MQIPFEACSTFMVTGASKSGKTQFVYKLLTTSNAFTKPIDKILYCYGIYQPFYDLMKKNIKNIDFQNGLPTDIDSFANGKHCVIICDDLMDQFINDNLCKTLFVQGSHHLSLSVIFITHNAFAQGKYARTIALNCNYLILFKNFRDGSQIVNLGKQMFPGQGQILVESYNDATSIPYNPLIVDLCANTNNKTRLRSNIFFDTWVYVPKSIKAEK